MTDTLADIDAQLLAALSEYKHAEWARFPTEMLAAREAMDGLLDKRSALTRRLAFEEFAKDRDDKARR